MEKQILIRIYALIDPEVEEPFYVGRTAMPLNRRLHGHVAKSKVLESKNSLRIRSILNKGSRPKMLLLDEQVCFSLEEIRSLEQSWIDKISLSFSLCNKVSSGCGDIPGNAKIEWTDSQLALLGKISDESLAQRIGVSKGTVNLKRRELKISAFHPKKEWTMEELALLGTMPDPDLANKLGTTRTVVQKKRNALGIPAYQYICWDGYLERLGTVPDTAIAKEMGIHPVYVGNKRKELDIPSFKESSYAEKWTKPALLLLGTIPDAKIAKIVGVSETCVRTKRNALNIPPSPSYRSH